MVKEVDIEGATNECFDKSGAVEDNIYYDPEIDKSKMEAAENQPKEKKQWALFGSTKKPTTKEVPDEQPTFFENPAGDILDTGVTTNPVYGQNWVAFDESTNESAGVTLGNPTYETVGVTLENPVYEVASVTLENPTYDTANTSENAYEVDV
eukprot:TRINITY_DN271_c0_g1_i1.p1 TRINITY_DN271_c0_g1~~TRINITY_DN271_c0_g1_i1.p1  ORF type:complete len:152 (+),score=31.01 TRINITY_DN271_c0_g1_i1:762-1217(+)